MHVGGVLKAGNALLQLVPSRETFFSKLGVENEQGMQDMETFLKVYRPILADIDTFLKQHGLDDPARV